MVWMVILRVFARQHFVVDSVGPGLHGHNSHIVGKSCQASQNRSNIIVKYSIQMIIAFGRLTTTMRV